MRRNKKRKTKGRWSKTGFGDPSTDMLTLLMLVLLCYPGTGGDTEVKFPEDSTEEVKMQPRFGLTYLGYYLSLLGATMPYAYQAIPIQTPLQNASVAPATVPTLFSPVPTTVTTTTVAPQMPSTFPTAPPSAPPTPFPAGIVTSYGTFPSIVVTAKPSELPAPLITAGGTVCGCLPVASCVNKTTRSGISVRIVTSPPAGVTCTTGLVYCCSPHTSNLCGIPNIIPGVKPGPGQADLGQFPWSAIILKSDDSYVGGGALITPMHILTAAHKVAGFGNGANLKVRLGDWDLSSTSEPVPHTEIKISKITNHPNFNAVSFVHDISVITLEKPVSLLAFPFPQINKICLPGAGNNFVGSRCWVAGWGKDQFNGAYQKIIKEVDVPVVGQADCQSRLRTTRLGASYDLDATSFLCAGGEPSKDACTGDGGNALACEVNGQFYIAGITVGGIECGLPNVPGLYTNVLSYVSWISAQIAPRGIDPRRKPS